MEYCVKNRILSPTQVDLSCTRGDTAEFDLVVVRNSMTVDLSDAKIWMTARRNRGGPIVFQKTSDPDEGIVIDTDLDNPGQATIKLASEDTSGLAAETVTLFYDIQVKTLTDLWTVNYGDLVVTPDSTTATE